jgi:hypothetical protein
MQLLCEAQFIVLVNCQLDNATPPSMICTVWKKGLCHGTKKTLVSIRVSNGNRIFALVVVGAGERDVTPVASPL